MQFTSQLQQFETLSAVPILQLQWLEACCELHQYSDGEFIGIQGEKITGPHFVLEGQVVLFMKQGNEKREISNLSQGSIFGYLPYSRSSVASLSAQANGSLKLLSFDNSRIREMIQDHFELTQALVHHMNNRVRDFTTLQQQNDKMAALGKLAAGLAHEMNNPASAIVSDALSLRNHLRMEPKAFKELTALHLEFSQVDGANEVLLKIMSSYSQGNLSLKDRTKREEKIADWLDAEKIDNAEEMSEIFSDFNVSFEDLDSFRKFIPQHARNTVFNWILNVLVTEKMVLDIQVSSERIAELIKSVKIYTHMDRGTEKISTDIHNGIRNTISILGHKFRRENVELTESFDETLQPVKAYAGELNQVWTNILDNALDSLEGMKNGKINITTEKDREFVKVIITDNGPGIPESIMNNIFDPFFTTKEIGKGTGMGLETVQRIVLKHKGSIKVASVPGETRFTICFQIDGDSLPNNLKA